MPSVATDSVGLGVGVRTPVPGRPAAAAGGRWQRCGRGPLAQPRAGMLTVATAVARRRRRGRGGCSALAAMAAAAASESVRVRVTVTPAVTVTVRVAVEAAAPATPPAAAARATRLGQAVDLRVWQSSEQNNLKIRLRPCQ